MSSTMKQDEAPTKPNIVFILVDNVGWGDFGVYGGTTPTPCIDRLANEGIRLNNYNVECQCTPSRSAIMTARMPVRSGTYTVPWPGQGASGLCPWEYTMAELLSDAGYATALYGKWHLGEIQGRMPNDQGFDEWWGILNSWDEAGYTSYPLFKKSGMEPPMIWEGKKGQKSAPVMPLDLNVRPIVDEKYLIPKTIDFIKRQSAAKKPFFVYLGYSEVHPPIIANPAFAGKSTSRGGTYSDIIGEMDYRVGQVLDAIKEAGADGNTIVVLTSDNGNGSSLVCGGVTGGSSGPWRGDFFNPPFEGSYRTAGMIRWPGKCLLGWLPTKCYARRTGCLRSPELSERQTWCRKTGRLTASTPQRSCWARATRRAGMLLCSLVQTASLCQSSGRCTRRSFATPKGLTSQSSNRNSRCSTT
ncbi:MAG TPA: sulfatase-like hydrolase/transferase [Acidobacteriaceae bacterium]|nr:sulfatase-like hydrolase/transferase [Acidobacteriaceae bacterium]